MFSLSNDANALRPNELRALLPEWWIFSEEMFVGLYAAYLSGKTVDLLSGGAIEVAGLTATTPFEAVRIANNIE